MFVVSGRICKDLTESVRQGLSACESLNAFFGEVAREARARGIPNCELFGMVTME